MKTIVCTLLLCIFGLSRSYGRNVKKLYLQHKLALMEKDLKLQSTIVKNVQSTQEMYMLLLHPILKSYASYTPCTSHNDWQRMTKSIKKLKQEITVLRESLQKVKDQHQIISFSTRLSHHITNLRHGKVIVFDHVYENNGKAYSSKTGIFTAPTDGLYVFFSTAMSKHGGRVETTITINGKSYAYIEADGTGAGYGTGSNMVVKQLRRGDRVYVAGRTYNYVHYWTSFSGFLLRGNY